MALKQQISIKQFNLLSPRELDLVRRSHNSMLQTQARKEQKPIREQDFGKVVFRGVTSVNFKKDHLRLRKQIDLNNARKQEKVLNYREYPAISTE